MFSADQALESIKHLDFPRVCGSEGEMQAMRFLVQQLRDLDLEARYHCFEDWWVEPVDPCLNIHGQQIQVEPAMSLPFLSGFEWMKGEGVEVEVSGRLVLPEKASTIEEKNFLAVRESFDISKAVVPEAAGQLFLFEYVPEFEAYLWATETVPSAYVAQQSVQNVLDVIGKEGTLQWKSRRLQRTFHNLIVEIPGKRLANEMVVVGAHLDSFPGTVGASDDAAGCAILLEAVKWFNAHPPDRTVRFVWFTGEELDRRGSRHFVEDYNLNPTTTKLFINIDSGFEQGAPGQPWIRFSDERVADWVKGWLDVKDLEISIGKTQSADVEPFQQLGIPTFWVCGHSRQPAHLPTDRPETIDRDKLALIGRLSLQAAVWAVRAGGYQ